MFWLIGVLILVLILDILIFGIHNLHPSSTLDINVHDTYFVIANSYFLIFIGTLLFFGVYLIRMLRRNFKNRIANLIFLISNLSLILILSYLTSYISSLRESARMMKHSLNNETIENTGNGWNNAFDILMVIQLLLLIWLVFCAFKSGQNYKQNIL